VTRFDKTKLPQTCNSTTLTPCNFKTKYALQFIQHSPLQYAIAGETVKVIPSNGSSKLLIWLSGFMTHYTQYCQFTYNNNIKWIAMNFIMARFHVDVHRDLYLLISWDV